MIRKGDSVMYTVGEFAKLAHVSKRLLRYYDEIGLLKPAFVDQSTGYRYYHAEQMVPLNRILVLKNLGLSLDQIRNMLEEDISTDELQGMLLLKKAEIEHHLLEEIKRIQKIEILIQSIRDREEGKPIDVIVKEIPAQTVLSVRTRLDTFEAALDLHGQIRDKLARRSGYGLAFTICHDEDPVDRNMDLEMGCMLQANENTHAPVPLGNNLQLRLRELPAVETMATIVIQGNIHKIHAGYGEIGLWAETSGYALVGNPRELMLQKPTTRTAVDMVTEIQFPVVPISMSKFSNV